MSSVAKPIIKQIEDNQDALDFFETVLLPAEDEKTQNIIMNFPTVYIHNWRQSGDFEIYVGESNDIFRRTRQHYDAASDKLKWQNKLLQKDARLFIIGHEHFNKSLTLDIENRLMHYMMSVECVKHVYNLRDNPQTSYYPMEEFDEIFRKIWRGLRKENKDLFPSESVIKDSAIYKASPLHKLTKEQKKARELIIQKVSKALENRETKQLIFIDGEAGTGKTVLNSSTFYELYCQAEESNKGLKCYLLVNHDEQITVYEQIAEKLGLTAKYGKVVSKPTTFINNHSEDDPIDVAFIDEAHLLLTQGKQSYESVKPTDNRGQLVWAALGAKTLELVHQNIEIGEVHDDMDILTLDASLIDEFIEKQKDIKKTTMKVEIDLVARIQKHGHDPKFQKLGEKLEELREKHEQGLVTSIEFLKLLLELAKEAVRAEKEVVPEEEIDRGKAALTELFNGLRNDKTPVIVERIVSDIDDIVKIVRFDGWQKTTTGKNEVKKALRSVVWIKYKIKDKDVFDKAYSYIEQYY